MHKQLVKRILRYIKGTQHLGLVYIKSNEDFQVYCDVDFAGDKITRKSITGVVCKFGGSAASWQSKKQQCVVSSTTEAEYISAASASKDVVWLKRLINEIGVCGVKQSAPLYVDNIKILNFIVSQSIRYHFIRDLYTKGEIFIEYVSSKNQIADIMTKALGTQRFVFLRNKIGLITAENV